MSPGQAPAFHQISRARDDGLRVRRWWLVWNSRGSPPLEHRSRLVHGYPMTERKPKRPRDPNQCAKSTVDHATVDEDELADLRKQKDAGQKPGRRGSDKTEGNSYGSMTIFCFRARSRATRNSFPAV